MFFIAGLILGYFFGKFGGSDVEFVAGRVVFQFMMLGVTGVTLARGGINAWAGLISGLIYAIVTAYLATLNFWEWLADAAEATLKMALPIMQIVMLIGLGVSIYFFYQSFKAAGCM